MKHSRLDASVIDGRVLTEAVRLACRAPSLHNSQPWRFVARGQELELHLDRDRLLPNTDTAGRQALLSCGALLDHVQVALAAAGVHTTVERFPSDADPDHLATLRCAPGAALPQAQRLRADAILDRYTDRLPLAAPPSPHQMAMLAHLAVDDDTIRVDLLTGVLRSELAEASVLTDALRRYNSAYHAELDWWTAPFNDRGGIPDTALVSAEESEHVELNRNFPVHGHSSRRENLGEDQAAIVILSTTTDSDVDVLRCGEALSAVLLECTAAGLATCPVTHVTEVGPARAVVAELIGGAAQPQVLIRVGIAPELSRPHIPTPRRPVTAVLHFAD